MNVKGMWEVDICCDLCVCSSSNSSSSNGE